MTTTRNISDIFPITAIENNCLVSGNGDVTMGWRCYCPEIFTLSEADLNELFDQLVAAFNKLPIGAVIHKQDFYYLGEYSANKEIEDFCINENQKVAIGRPTLNHYCNIYLSMPIGKIGAINAMNSSAVRLTSYFKGDAFKGHKKDFAYALEVFETLETGLKNVKDLAVHRMEEKDMYAALWEYWNGSWDQTMDQVDKSALLPPLHTGNGRIELGEKHLAILSMVNNGDKITNIKKAQSGDTSLLKKNLKVEDSISIELGYSYPIGLGLPLNHIVNTIFEMVDSDRITIDFYWKKVNESLLAGFGFEKSRNRLHAINGFQQSVSQKGMKVCKVAQNVILMESTAEQLEKSLRYAKSVYENIADAKVWSENKELLPLFVGSSPGYARGNYRKFYSVVEHATCLMPLDTHYISDEIGNFFMDRYGNPVIVDLWNSSHTVVRHGIVEGATRSGKSVWVNNLIAEDLAKNGHVMVLDIGHSYRDLCEMYQGLYIDSADRNMLSFNIFLCDKDQNGHYTPDDDKRIFINSVLMAIWLGNEKGGMEMKAILKDLVDKFYQHINQKRIDPNFDIFYEYISVYENEVFKKEREKFFSFESMRTVYEQYITGGDYGKLLNNDSNINLEDVPFVVFDIESVEKDSYIFPVVSLIIMEMVMNKIRKMRSQMKRFIIDEGWKVLKGELQDFVEYLYRTFAKHEGAIWLATQKISDFEEAGASKSLIANSGNLVLMKRTTFKNYDDLKRFLSLTSHEIQLVKDLQHKDHLGYREFFIKQGDYARIFRSEYAEKALAVYSSTGKEKVEIMKLLEETGSIKSAINQYIENKYKSRYEIN